MKIIIVSTYSQMSDLIDKLKFEYTDDSIEVVDNETLSRPEIVKYINESDADGVISRGGVFDYLQSRVNKLIIPIDVTPYDILASIDLEKLANTSIIGFKEITEYALKLKELGHLPINVITIEKREDLNGIIPTLSKDTIYYSGYATYLVLKEHALDARLIVSSLQSIKDSIKALKAYVNRITEDRTREKVFDAYLGHEKLNVYIYRNKKLYISRISNSKISKIIEEKINMHFESLMKRKKIELVFYESEYMIKIYNYQFESDGNTYQAIKANIVDYPFALKKVMVFDNETQVDLPMGISDEAILYAKGILPIILTGKDDVALRRVSNYFLHNSMYKESTSMIIDFKSLSEKGIKELLENENSVLSLEGHTFIISSFDILTSQEKSAFKNYLLNSNFLFKNKVIFEANDKESIGKYLDNIPYYFMHIDDIADAEWRDEYIRNYINFECKGFDKVIVDILHEYPYKNEAELKRIVSNLKVFNKVTIKELLKVLIDHNAKTDEYDMETLEEHNYKLVKLALKACNNNYTKAAETLGIGRTTLWRILKNKSLE